MGTLEVVGAGTLGACDALEIVVPACDVEDADLCRALNGFSLPVKEIVIVDMGKHQSLTFRSPIGNAFVKIEELAGLHPASAARLELWRFSQFFIKRLHSETGVHLFSLKAQKQPQDERLLAMVEVFNPEVINGPSGLRTMPGLSLAFRTACQSMREAQSKKNKMDRLHWNHMVLSVDPMPQLTEEEMKAIAGELVPFGSHLGLDQVQVYAELKNDRDETSPWCFRIRGNLKEGLSFEHGPREGAMVQPIGEKSRQEIHARRRGVNSPEAILRLLKKDLSGNSRGEFLPFDVVVDPASGQQHLIQSEWPENHNSGVLIGILNIPTVAHPQGVSRVTIISNPLQNMGSLSEPECRRIIGALDLARDRRLPVYWLPVSGGAKIDFESGTENLDWTARVLRRIVEFTENGGMIDILVAGINVGAQAYFDAEATMISTTKGFLVMTEEGSMVLTGKRALDVSGAVSAEDNLGIGGCERIMGPSGQAQAMVKDISAGHQLMLHHADLVMGEGGVPLRVATPDPFTRDITLAPYPLHLGHGFTKLGAIFSEETNPGRKKPFSVRPVMQAVKDSDAFVVERWGGLGDGAEGVSVWETRVGGIPAGFLGIDAMGIPRVGAIPSDGPESWSPSTLFPKGAYKLGRGLSAFSGQIPVVIFANLSGFDGSPESLRKWQLVHGAEIGRALVKFQGPVLLVVLSRYHGGAYVVFSTALNDQMEAVALKGSYASVIGGSAAASVVFNSAISRKIEQDPGILGIREELKTAAGRQRMSLEARLSERLSALRTTLSLETAEQFDRIHSVERAAKVGSLKSVIEPSQLRPYIINFLSGRLGLVD
ncbi:hypothetical protein KKF84_22355 [Myxococcota bacterium]|nr:hypothetical protein [Myxococcota bacterium]